MSVLGYVTDGTSAQMQAMSDQALQLGADTVFSANEAADGMVELAKAGMDTEDVMGAIPGVMDLAAAGQISVAEAAGLAAATIATFGLEASQTTEVADVLAAAANASSADIRDLAFGVQNAGSVFASSGQSVETLATMMALLANNGLNASDAATSLKTMTMRLTAPTEKAAKVMDSLGIAVFDADGNMRDYQDIIGDLESATKGLSDEQRSAALNTIFGADAIRAAIIMADEGVAGYEAMEAAVSEQGAAAAMADAQNSGLAGAMEQISGSLDTLFTKLALPFLDTISEQMGKLAEFVNGLGDLPQPVINAALAFLALAGGIGLVLAGAAGVAAIIGALATPIGLAVVVVLALAFAVGALWAAWELNWGNIQGKTTEALAVIQPLIDAFAASMGTISAAATDIGTKFATAFEEADFPTFDELFADLLEGDFGGLTGKLQKALDSLVLDLKIEFQVEQKMAQAQADTEKAVAAAGLAAGAVPAQVADAMTAAIEGHNWKQEGTNIGTVIRDALVAGIQAQPKREALIEKERLQFEKEPFGPLVADISNLGTIFSDAFSLTFDAPSVAAQAQLAIANARTAWTDFIDGIMGVFIEPFAPVKTKGPDPILSQEKNLMRPSVDIDAIFAELNASLSMNMQLMTASIGTFFSELPTTISTTFSNIATAISTAVTDMGASVMATITGLFSGEKAMNTSVSDRLRGAEDERFSWSEFIPPFEWPAAIAAFAWPEVIFSFAWPSAIAAFKWPDSLSFDWGTWMEPLDWGRFVSWLAAPWTGGGGSGGGNDRPEHLNMNDPRPQAMGTPYWAGGTALVGEHGRELVTLPQGSRIYSNGETEEMLGGSVTINVNVASINSTLDIEALAAQLARRFQQKMRS
jgi:TP901 family phage tail tape measure protein